MKPSTAPSAVEPWRNEALCIGMTPNLFFPERGDDSDTARALCADCPSRHPCAEWGIAHEHFGIWGGLSERERRKIRRQRRITLVDVAA